MKCKKRRLKKQEIVFKGYIISNTKKLTTLIKEKLVTDEIYYSLCNISDCHIFLEDKHQFYVFSRQR